MQHRYIVTWPHAFWYIYVQKQTVFSAVCGAVYFGKRHHPRSSRDAGAAVQPVTPVLDATFHSQVCIWLAESQVTGWRACETDILVDGYALAGICFVDVRRNMFGVAQVDEVGRGTGRGRGGENIVDEKVNDCGDLLLHDSQLCEFW